MPYAIGETLLSKCFITAILAIKIKIFKYDLFHEMNSFFYRKLRWPTVNSEIFAKVLKDIFAMLKICP